MRACIVALMLLISGTIVSGTGATAGDAAPPPADPVPAAKEAYEAALATCKAKLLAEFDAREKLAQKKPGLSVDQRIELVKKLRAEKAAFESEGAMPTSPEMAAGVGNYERLEKSARAKCANAFRLSAEAAAKQGDVDRAEQILAEKKAFLDPPPAAPGAEEPEGDADPAKKGPRKGGGLAAGWIPLFNGKNLDGWRKSSGDDGDWFVDDGALVTEGGGRWLLSERSFSDFELRFEYRWKREGGNSGVILRSPLEGKLDDEAMELELLDDDSMGRNRLGELSQFLRTGALYRISPVKRAANNKPIGEWNAVSVVAVGRKVVVQQNGETLSSIDLNSLGPNPDRASAVRRTEGVVGLQSLRGRIEYRNLYVKEMKF